MIIEKLENRIFYFKNVIDNPKEFINKIESTDFYCNEYTSVFKWSTWTSSTMKSEIYGLSKDGTFIPRKLYDENDFEIYKIASTIKYISDFCIASYSYMNNIRTPWLPNFFSIKKYNSGVDMGPHIDSNDPTDKKHPVVSGVMYLNDDYDGGELLFPNQSLSIKPEAGSVILFPSHNPYIHHPQKILNGNKYMVPLFWYEEAFE